MARISKRYIKNQFTSQKKIVIPFTEEGYQKVLDQKAELLSQRPDAVENLAKARAMGDLSENGYYKASRAKLSSIDARLRKVERLVRFGKIVKSTNSGKVEIGCKVLITDGESEYEYTLVGGYESNPAEKTISYRSPIGKALIGNLEQDVVEVIVPAGKKSYTILKITPIE
ncbi:GreA/GreB family elongation factor [Patescibacteria group bacterium]